MSLLISVTSRRLFSEYFMHPSIVYLCENRFGWGTAALRCRSVPDCFIFFCRHFTREALPRLDNYRNIMSIHAAYRPTLDELHNATLTSKVRGMHFCVSSRPFSSFANLIFFYNFHKTSLTSVARLPFEM